MSSISQTIKIMKDSAYFTAWEEVLFSKKSFVEWELILDDIQDDEQYFLFAQKLHEANVPYVIVSEYIDEFFRHYSQNINRHKIKNKIAEAYLRKKLSDDKELIDIEIAKKISISIESKQELINAHMKWMKYFICNIIGESVYLELDCTKCYVGEWLEEEGDGISRLLYERHKNLHSMARSAIRMYQKKDFAYFLLLYTDILSSSYQIRDSIMNIYFSRRVISIFQDPVTEKSNYFQLKLDLQNREVKNSILMFNIKEFSKINLLYGHDAGDKIIKEIASVVDAIKNVINVYRIYGDEFAVIFSTENKTETIALIKEKLHQHEFAVENDSVVLSFYGSVSEINDHVLEHCEYGLMMSKHKYGDIVDANKIEESVYKKYANKITLSQELRLAFLDNRILSFYQPIVDVQSEKITKYEVLMRVEDINGNILEPVEFLDVLKEMYIYPEVTKLIIKNSFELFNNNTYEFSVNLSFADIINVDTKAFILALLKKYPEVSTRCTFELLENEAVLNEIEVRDFFSELHKHGVKIALDDFGVGYSNYDCIFKFNIDYIKIDGSLTESILQSEKSRVLIESITTVARKLNSKIIVEFVSSKEIYDEIIKLDIDYIQGYYIAKPSKRLVSNE